MFRFQLPYALLLLPVIFYLFFKKSNQGAIKVPGVEHIKKYSKQTKKHLVGKGFILLSLIFMVFALARPQKQIENKKIQKEGIDIVIALDLSRSMLQKDFEPNRLEKAKVVLNDFLSRRDADRMSLVVFGGDAYTKVPLTFDHNVLKDIISKITVDDITSNNRTAIGMGLGVALNRLKNSEAKSKVVILMTDGENNSGEMSPLAAAELAKEMGIKVYTVGIGAREVIVPSFFGVQKIKNTELDENLLKTIASISGGNYFRAGDSKEFSEIFNQIDKLEKTSINSRDYYDIVEFFEPLLKISLILFLLGILFEFLIYIRIP